MNNYIRSPLSVNLINTKLSISFSEELFQKDLYSKLNKNNMMIELTYGICSITDYYIQSYDNINFTIYFKLNLASDGKQILNLNIDAYNLNKDNIKINDQHVCLNKQNLLFTKDSIIKTDQGALLIENIKSNKHSINNNKIIKIIKSKNYENDNLILIKKNSLFSQIPNKDTILKNNQKIFYCNEYVELQNIYFKNSNNNNFSLIKNYDGYLYNLVIDNTPFINLNNLDIELPNYEDLSFFDETFYDFNLIQNVIDKKIEEKFYSFKKNFLIENQDKTANLNDNKIVIKNNENNNKKQFIIKNNINKNLVNVNNTLIWNHWIEYGKKENKKMNLLLKFDNADFERYKKDYPFLSKKLNLNNHKIWEHWKINGIKENKKMHIKVTFQTADFDLFRKEYPEISKIYVNDNSKIWEYWKSNTKNTKMKIKLNYDNCDFDKFKRDYPNLCLRIKKNNDKKNKKK